MTPSSSFEGVLDRLVAICGKPEQLRSDIGPEFIGSALHSWTDEARVSHHFINPGKPMENAIFESFNGRSRDECLNASWFFSIDHARTRTEEWAHDYNKARPHGSLGLLPQANLHQYLEQLLLDVAKMVQVAMCFS